MARYILTFGTDRIAGSRGGSTFQKSGTTYVIRKRNTPVQKKSPAQTIQQNQFASVQQNWQQLTPGEKDSFIDESVNYPRTDSLGNPYIMSGQNLQALANINLSNTDQSQIIAMPPVPVFPLFAINSIGMAISSSFLIIQININPIPAGFALKLFSSNRLETQSLDQNISYKLLSVVQPLTNQIGLNFYSEYSRSWGESESFANKFFAAKAVLIDIASGIESPQSFAVGQISP